MSSNCGVCGQVCVEDEVDPTVKCAGVCEKLFHARCIKDELSARKTRSARSDWKCKDCRTTPSVRSSADSGASTALTKEVLVRVLEDFKSEVFSELRSFKNEMSELSTAVSFNSDKLDESNKLMEQVRADLAAIQKENLELRRRNADLTNEVKVLKDRVRACEQYSRRANVEISGLPVTQNEDVFNIVKDVAAAVGVEILATDISTAHRVPSFTKGRTPSLIVNFTRRSARDCLIRKFKEKKDGITARDVNPTFLQHKVYINEHLSPDNKVFLAKLKSKCRDIGFAYAWSRDGKFFVRKSQGERYKRVDTYEDLEKLK